MKRNRLLMAYQSSQQLSSWLISMAVMGVGCTKAHLSHNLLSPNNNDMSRKVHSFLIVFILCLIGVFPFKTLAAEYPEFQSSHFRRPFAVLGDTQQTSKREQVVLNRELNIRETQLILQYIGRENIDLLVHLGDAVFNGSSRKQWKKFDRLMKPIINMGIPVLLTLGNHEYLGANSQALKNVKKRFPQIKRKSWYKRIYLQLGLLFLNTNKEDLGREMWSEQTQWFKDELEHMRTDESISGILVFAHHPPFTNSEVTGDEKNVQEGFLKSFYESKKTLAFTTGHAHGYEHFFKKEKHFIVSAGGGGPRVKYLSSTQKRHQDLYRNEEGARPFNYLIIDQDDLRVTIAVKGFDKIDRQVRQIDRIEIPFP